MWITILGYIVCALLLIACAMTIFITLLMIISFFVNFLRGKDVM